MPVSRYTDTDYLTRYHAKAATHWLNLNPAIIRSLRGDLKGKRILDVGCGDGDLTAAMAARGATVVGIDTSKEWIKTCHLEHRKPRLSFMVADGAQLPFPKGSFDCVVMNMVLLNVESFAKVRQMLSEASRVLKKDGVMVFSDLHPAMLLTKQIGMRSQTYSKGFSYFKNGAAYRANVQLDTSSISFSNRHWTLEEYALALKESGLHISSVIEVQYVESDGRWHDFPEYLLFVCGK